MLFKKRKHDLFEALLTPQLDSGYRFAFHLLRDEADAEDLLQEAAQLAFERFHQFEEGTNFKAWFFRILRNRYIDILRKRKRQPGLEGLSENLRSA